MKHERLVEKVARRTIQRYYPDELDAFEAYGAVYFSTLRRHSAGRSSDRISPEVIAEHAIVPLVVSVAASFIYAYLDRRGGGVSRAPRKQKNGTNETMGDPTRVQRIKAKLEDEFVQEEVVRRVVSVAIEIETVWYSDDHDQVDHQ